MSAFKILLPAIITVATITASCGSETMNFRTPGDETADQTRTSAPIQKSNRPNAEVKTAAKSPLAKIPAEGWNNTNSQLAPIVKTPEFVISMLDSSKELREDAVDKKGNCSAELEKDAAVMSGFFSAVVHLELDIQFRPNSDIVEKQKTELASVQEALATNCDVFAKTWGTFSCKTSEGKQINDRIYSVSCQRHLK